MPTLSTLIYVIHQDHVLLMRRLKQPNLGQWSAPGGRLEAREAPAECALRELAEETGIIAENLILRAIISDEGPQSWLMFVYLYTLDPTGPRPEIFECDEGEFAWIELSQVLSLNIPAADYIFYPRVLDLTLPVYEVKFQYDQDEKLLDFQNYS